MKKRWMVLICMMMVLAVSAGCFAKDAAAEEAGYDKTIDFTMTNYFSVWCMSTVADYKDDVYDYIVDRFNIEPDVWSCTEGEEEKTRMWINGGTMPDVMWWESFTLTEYRNYANQGLLKALPEGWEERWPNIEKVIRSSGLENLIKVDGETYVIPHAIFGLYCPADGGLVDNQHLYYRKDWAEEVGMTDFGKDSKITLPELKEYLTKVKEAGLTDQGMNTSSECMNHLFRLGTGGIYDSDYYETEDGFDWVLDDEEYIEAIKLMQEWYNEGLIDPDFYTDDNAATVGYNQFVNGTNPAYWWVGDAVDAMMVLASCNDGFADGDAIDRVGFATIVGDDGTSYTYNGYNYWATTVFSPDIDDETFERVLDLIDWISSDEGFTTYSMGVPGVDWDYDENGEYELLNENAEFRRDIDVFAYLGYCQDDFAFSGRQAGLEPEVLDTVKGILSMREEGVVHEKSDHYAEYQSDSKNNYSMSGDAKIVEIVVGNLDVDSEWEKYCKTNENIWKPLLDELNAEYFNK